MTTILLPVYQPGHRLPALVDDLRDAAPGLSIVVVDDGSDPPADTHLEEAGRRGADVVRLPANRGKGVALRTGFRHAPAGHHVVTADADGQHHVSDILRVAQHVTQTERLTLGVRRFDGDVPLRSRFGNTLTGLLFRARTGCRIDDTQTGLRGYPAGLRPWLETIPGDRFEYEMAVLLRAARAGHPIEEVQVATTYVDDNASSHFGSLSDSIRVYGALLRSGA